MNMISFYLEKNHNQKVFSEMYKKYRIYTDKVVRKYKGLIVDYREDYYLKMGEEKFKNTLKMIFMDQYARKISTKKIVQDLKKIRKIVD